MSSNILKPLEEEITEEEYNNAPTEDVISPLELTDGYTPTEYKKMKTTIISVNNRYRYKVNLDWKKMPKTRSYDVIGIGIDSTVSGISSTKHFQQTLVLDNLIDSCEYVTKTEGAWTLSSSGYAVTFKLHGSIYGLKPVVGLSSSMYFEVQKLTSQKLQVLNAYGDYKHAQKTVTSSVSSAVSVGTGGISIDMGTSVSGAEAYDRMTTAQATWSGLNW